MRALVISVVLSFGVQATAGETAQLWMAPGAGELGAAASHALTRGFAARGRALEERSFEAQPEPSLRAPLAEALSAYRALKIDEATAALTRLAAEAQGLGGGDLDTRSLADLYLHLGLCALERSNSELAWDSFVRAVRVDPSRALDPAQVPPRATAAHRRAQNELGQLPSIELELRIPAEARAHIDGDDGHGPGPLGRRLLPGPHLVRVELLGYEPYRGVIALSSPNEIFTPTLRPLGAPAPTAANDARGFASLQRASEGWRLTVRGLQQGMVVEASATVHPDDVQRIAGELIDRVFGPLTVAVQRRPIWKRWWVWTIAGAAVAAVAIAVPLAVVHGRGSPPGSAGGPLQPVVP